MTTFESRVLAVLHPEEWTPQAQVITAARMAPARCIDTLRMLVDLGRVEHTRLRQPRRGRPAYLYRRRA